MTNKPTTVYSLTLVTIGIILARGWFNNDYPIGSDALAGPPISWYLDKELSALRLFPTYNPYWYLGGTLLTHPLPIYYLYTIVSWVSNYAIAVKVVHLTFFLLSSLTMYFYIRKKTSSNEAAFIAGLLYAYNPYALVEFIFEGHGAFSMAYMLTPLVFFSLDLLLKGKTVVRVVTFSFLLAMLILTHPQSVFLIGPLIGLYALYKLATNVIVNISFSGMLLKVTILKSAVRDLVGRTVLLLLSLMLSLMFSAIWWLPFLFARSKTFMTTFSFTDVMFPATPFGILSLRPPSSNYPPIEFSLNTPLPTQLLQLSILVPVLLGVFLEKKKGILLTLSAFFFSLIALGLQSPIKIYEFLFTNIPFYNSIRTPSRFMFTISFLFALLGGLGVAGLRRYVKKVKVKSAFVLLLAVLIVGNVWSDAQNGFRTFKFPPEWDYAIKWLAEQPDDTYRIASPPHKAWIYSPEFGTVLNPMFFTHHHHKESVGGNIPSDASMEIGTILEQLFWYPQSLPIDSKSWLDYFNVKYVVIDLADASSASSLVLPTDYLDPSSWSWAEGTIGMNLSLVSRKFNNWRQVLRSHYNFSNPYRDWLIIATKLHPRQLNEKSDLYLRFYLEEDQPDIFMGIDLIDARGARFGVDLFQNLTRGWNELRVPLNELRLRYSLVNASLELGLARWLWIGVSEKANFDHPHVFDLYFSNVTITTNSYSSGLKTVWQGNTLTIYENENYQPRIFKLLLKPKACVNSMDSQGWIWAEGTAPRMLIQETLTIDSHQGTYVKSYYNFSHPYREWLILATDISDIKLQGNEFLNFTYYLPQDVHGIGFTFDLHDGQGGRYGISVIPETRRGVHQVLIPVSLFLHRYSKNYTPVSPSWESMQWLWIGVYESSDFSKIRNFSVYFLNVTFMEPELEKVKFRRVGPAAYDVEFSSDDFAFLVLSAAYAEEWTASSSLGIEISAVPIIGVLNGFYLPPGDYVVQLRLRDPPATNIARAITLFSLLVSAFIILPNDVRRRVVVVVKARLYTKIHKLCVNKLNDS